MSADISLHPKTIFCDIDGVLLEHKGCASDIWLQKDPIVLADVLSTFREWEAKGYTIILTTGRKECMRKATEKQLKKLGLFYDQLVMSVGRGIRVLINDLKPYTGEPTAVAICVNRNEGLGNVKV